MGEPENVVRARARLLELERSRMSEEDMVEWRRLHRVIWGEGDPPHSYMVSALVDGKMLFSTGLSLEEALKLTRVTLRTGAKGVTVQQLDRG